jgi:hypothetical protein
MVQFERKCISLQFEYCNYNMFNGFMAILTINEKISVLPLRLF